MGVSLLLMAGILGPLREEASEAYLVAVLSVEEQDGYGIVIATPDGTRLKQLTTNSKPRYGDVVLFWSADGGSIYHRLEPYWIAEDSSFLRIHFPSGRQQILMQNEASGRLMLSPDGRWIIYGKDGDLHLLNTLSGTIQIIANDIFTYSWAKQGKLIHFSRGDPYEGVSEEYWIRFDGTVVHSKSSDMWSMVWSPNGEAIGYSISDSTGWQLYVENLPSRDRQRIPLNGRFSLYRWLRSDWLIVMLRNETGVGRGLVRMRPDGHQFAPLLFGEVGQAFLDASSDGKWVYIQTFDRLEERADIYRVDPTTLNREHLLKLEWSQYGRLSDNEDMFIFMGRYMGVDGLYRMNVDGTGLKRLLSVNDHYDEWGFYDIPEMDWVGVVILYDDVYGYDTRLAVNINTGAIRELPRSSAVSFSPMIDTKWEPIEVTGVGIGMLLGAMGVMGWRVRRAG